MVVVVMVAVAELAKELQVEVVAVAMAKVVASLSCGPCRQAKRAAHTFVPVGCTKPGVSKKSNLIQGE